MESEEFEESLGGLLLGFHPTKTYLSAVQAAENAESEVALLAKQLLGAAKRLLQRKDKSLLVSSASEQIQDAARELLTSEAQRGEPESPATALGHFLRGHADQVVNDATTLRLLVQTESDRLGSPMGARLHDAFCELRDSSGIDGIERGEKLRSARDLLHEVTSEPEGERSAVAWLVYGLIIVAIGAAGEADSHFARALRLASDPTTFTSYLAQRALAYCLAARGTEEEAAVAAGRALPFRSDYLVLMEAARYEMAGQQQKAKPLLKAAIQLNPLAAFLALADPVLSRLRDFVVQEMERNVPTLRNEAMMSFNSWSGLCERVVRLEEFIGANFEGKDRFVPRTVDLSLWIGDGGYFDAVRARSSADYSAIQLEALVAKNFASDEAKITLALTNCEEESGDAHRARASALALANRRRSEGIRAAECSADQCIKSNDRASQACAAGLGLGCGAFCLYVAICAFMTFRSVKMGLDTPFSVIFLTLSAGPIVAGVGAQLAAGLRKTSLDAEVRRRTKEAEDQCTKAVAAADRELNESLKALENELAELESKMAKIQEARAILSSGSFPSRTASTRLPSEPAAA